MKSQLLRGIKVLEVGDDYYIASSGYSILKFINGSESPILLGRIRDKYAKYSHFWLTRRLLRAEINSFYTLPNGDWLAIAKKGIFKQKSGEKDFKKTFAVPRGSRPLNLCVLPTGEIYFGEYFSNFDKEAVNIYRSIDNGDTWIVAFTFPKGEINHVHGLFWDKFEEKLWVVTGDRENECIIGYTTDGFKTLNEVFRGGQEYRATVLLFFQDHIAFGTDSQYMQNTIKVIDRKSLTITDVQSIQGTAIKGGQTSDIAFLSTTVEPSEVNKDKNSHVWVSADGLHWKEVYHAPKDCLPAIFQFGSIEFPTYRSAAAGSLYASGRALKHIGGNSIKIDLHGI